MKVWHEYVEYTMDKICTVYSIDSGINMNRLSWDICHMDCNIKRLGMWSYVVQRV